MGRHSTKDTVDGTRNLDVLYFQKRGLFSWTPGFTYTMSWRLGEETVSSIGYALVGPCGSPTALRLKYSAIHWEEKFPCEYQVGLTSTSCNYGGFRYWFLCPLWKSGLPCNRRCRFLYLPSGNNYFGCRKCYELAYESSRRSHGRFYELIERPMKILDKAQDQFHRARSQEKRWRVFRRAEWAQRMLVLGSRSL